MFDIVYITEEEAKNLQGAIVKDGVTFNPLQDLKGNWFVSYEERKDCDLLWLKKKPVYAVELSEIREDKM